jgi:hypothetical protein
LHFTFAVYAVRGDATNSAVQNDNTKAHVCEVTSVFDFGDANDVPAPDADPECPTVKEDLPM